MNTTPVDHMTALHSLHLDERQRAMLAAMGTPVWWPEAITETAAEAKAAPTPPTTVRPAPAAAPVALPAAAPTAEPAIAPLDWDALTEAIQTCQACGLCQGRQRAVPGMGNRQARWMIVGEAPGEQEDKQGLPFVGPA
jgi:DNA polymerase